MAWEEAGRWFDPFRPAIPQQGLDSANAVVGERLASLQAMRDTWARTDVFIFTLGLTEAWVDDQAGVVYPMCPGTLRGCHDPQRHRLVNLGHEEVVGHLEASFALLRGINPGMRFLLTVSPVPLTATTSDQHVLSATTWSKSVLRAAAGEMVRRHADVDYFPSYELIAGFQSGGRWYEPNLRGVTRAGVDHVMAHFERGLNGESLGPWLDAVPQGAGPAVPVLPAEDGAAADGADLVCEEERLNGLAAASADPARAAWCLMGDSHMNFLSRALGRAEVAHAGGMVMIGSAWCQDRFHPDEQELLVPLAQADSRRRWAAMRPFFSDGEQLRPGAGRRVLTNLGVQSHLAAPQFHEWAQAQLSRGDIAADAAVAFYQRLHGRRLKLLGRLLATGYEVLVLTDPPTQDKVASNAPLLPAFQAYEDLCVHVLEGMGCRVLRARQRLAQGGTPAHFYKLKPTPSGAVDWIHGSEAYYDALVPWLLDELQAVPA